MIRNNVSNSAMNLLARFVFTALLLVSLVVPAGVRCEEATPTASAKLDRAQLEAQFKKLDADRAAAKENTKERADVARNAMQVASDIAWLAFDAGKFDEAATWFATSAKLKEDSHVNARGYWEEYHRTGATELDGKVDEQIKKLQDQLATVEESKKDILRKLIQDRQSTR